MYLALVSAANNIQQHTLMMLLLATWSTTQNAWTQHLETLDGGHETLQHTLQKLKIVPRKKVPNAPSSLQSKAEAPHPNPPPEHINISSFVSFLFATS